MFNIQSFLIFSFFIFSSSQLFAKASTQLNQYNVERDSITISGISSGAFMAIQMATAYSKTFSGMASVAGGIYWCSQGSTQKAQSECMSGTERIDPQIQIQKARELSEQGEIDSLENLSRQKVYLFSSPKDAIIKPPSSDKLFEFLKTFIPESQIKFEKTIETAHGFPTLDFGASCKLGFLPWILKCNYDLAAEILKSFYELKQPRVEAKKENLLIFDQSEFGNAQTPLFSTGWIYVPDYCKQGGLCQLHVALHGCQMNPDYIQDQFASRAGYNEWAESNQIIVLYPQSAKLGQANPYGCWDWFGFTGENFVTKDGAQMKAIKSMVDRIKGL